jgi:protein translocase SEC61 complex gamma subunit
MNVKETLSNYRRVLQVTKKPGKDEYFLTIRICAISITLVGLTGFVFYFISVLLGM